MLIESDAFDTDNPPPPPATWADAVMRHCTFDGLDLEGIIFDGIMESCQFTGSALYWAFFNVALIAGTRFENCTFSGASFRGSTFVECEFVECRFALDNLDSDCTIDDCLMAACTFDRCEWVIKPGSDHRDITKTRWLGCTAKSCTGFNGLV